jgi:hypothetical protein
LLGLPHLADVGRDMPQKAHALPGPRVGGAAEIFCVQFTS